MAVIVRTRVRVEDAAGVPVSGGKFRVYLANTTTLATLYSDAALSVSLTNPVVAGSDGWCAEIFCASANYDCATLTAADVVIKSEDDVPSLGSDASTFSRDFTNSRFLVEGVAGTVWLEVGDASPDNVGGTGRLSGYARTQADLITIDAAAVNAGTADGALKENSKKLQGSVYVDNQAFSAVASLIIPLTASPTGVRMWKLDIWDFLCTGLIRFQLSYDGGGTYKSGAADYFSSVSAHGNAVDSTSAATTTTFGMLTVAALPLAPFLGKFSIDIVTPNSGTVATLVDSRYNGHGVLGAANTPIIEASTAYGTGGYGRATHIKIIPSAGTMTGLYRLMPQRGTGDA